MAEVYIATRDNPLKPEMLQEMAAWRAAGNKLILFVSEPKPIGYIIAAAILGVPCRVIREATREEYIRESKFPESAAAFDYGPDCWFYEIDAVD